MNTIKKLTESISNFFTEIAYHYEIPSSEIASTLMEINFYSLFQTLCREAEPVYAFRSYGKDDCLLNYWGEKLFPCKAKRTIIFLYLIQRVAIVLVHPLRNTGPRQPQNHLGTAFLLRTLLQRIGC